MPGDRRAPSKQKHADHGLLIAHGQIRGSAGILATALMAIAIVERLVFLVGEARREARKGADRDPTAIGPLATRAPSGA